MPTLEAESSSAAARTDSEGVAMGVWWMAVPTSAVRRATGGRSLAPMTTIPVPSAMIALVGLLKVRAKRLIGGGVVMVSSVVTGVQLWAVSMCAKLSVPLLAV